VSGSTSLACWLLALPRDVTALTEFTEPPSNRRRGLLQEEEEFSRPQLAFALGA
jgi:hypothetical protein